MYMLNHYKQRTETVVAYQWNGSMEDFHSKDMVSTYEESYLKQHPFEARWRCDACGNNATGHGFFHAPYLWKIKGKRDVLCPGDWAVLFHGVPGDLLKVKVMDNTKFQLKYVESG